MAHVHSCHGGHVGGHMHTSHIGMGHAHHSQCHGTGISFGTHMHTPHIGGIHHHHSPYRHNYWYGGIYMTPYLGPRYYGYNNLWYNDRWYNSAYYDDYSLYRGNQYSLPLEDTNINESITKYTGEKNRYINSFDDELNRAKTTQSDVELAETERKIEADKKRYLDSLRVKMTNNMAGLGEGYVLNMEKSKRHSRIAGGLGTGILLSAAAIGFLTLCPAIFITGALMSLVPFAVAEYNDDKVIGLNHALGNLQYKYNKEAIRAGLPTVDSSEVTQEEASTRKDVAQKTLGSGLTPIKSYK